LKQAAGAPSDAVNWYPRQESSPPRPAPAACAAPRSHLQVVFLDDQAGPDQIEQLVLAHDPVAAFDQREQHIEGAGAQLAAPRSRAVVRASGCTSKRPNRKLLAPMVSR